MSLFSSERRRPFWRLVFILALFVLASGGVVTAAHLTANLMGFGGPETHENLQKYGLAADSLRRLRAEQAVMSRRETILRQELKQLEQLRNQVGYGQNAQLENDLRRSRETLVALLRDQQSADGAQLMYMEQLGDAQIHNRIAALSSDEMVDFIYLDWPVEPEHGISAHFMDEEYEETFDTPHLALDIPQEQNSEVLAAATGIVTDVIDNGYGYSSLVIKHPGFVTVYGHIFDFLVEEGDAVRQGEVVARSGGEKFAKGTGSRSTGPHLHFELVVDGKWVDPLPYLPYHERVHTLVAVNQSL